MSTLRAQALEAIHQSALAQSRLVGDLLDVSRAISGKLYVDLRPVDIERVVRDAIEAIARRPRAKHDRGRATRARRSRSRSTVTRPGCGRCSTTSCRTR